MGLSSTNNKGPYGLGPLIRNSAERGIARQGQNPSIQLAIKVYPLDSGDQKEYSQWSQSQALKT